MPRPLTEDEKATFEQIREDSRVALVQTVYDGEETAVICLIVEHGDKVDMLPLALLMDDTVFERLEPPLPDATRLPVGAERTKEGT